MYGNTTEKPLSPAMPSGTPSAESFSPDCGPDFLSALLPTLLLFSYQSCRLKESPDQRDRPTF